MRQEARHFVNGQSGENMRIRTCWRRLMWQIWQAASCCIRRSLRACLPTQLRWHIQTLNLHRCQASQKKSRRKSLPVHLAINLVRRLVNPVSIQAQSQLPVGNFSASHLCNEQFLGSVFPRRIGSFRPKLYWFRHFEQRGSTDSCPIGETEDISESGRKRPIGNFNRTRLPIHPGQHFFAGQRC